MTYAKALLYSQEVAKGLRAFDERFRATVSITLQDGAHFYWPDAFALMSADATHFMVFTEHYGTHVFSTDDLIAPNREWAVADNDPRREWTDPEEEADDE